MGYIGANKPDGNVPHFQDLKDFLRVDDKHLEVDLEFDHLPQPGGNSGRVSVGNAFIGITENGERRKLI